MKLRDQFRTGWRNLSRQKLRSCLTIFAIVIGAVSVTVMLSLVTSARSFLTSSFKKTGEDRRVVVTPSPGLGYREATNSTYTDGSGVKLTDEVAATLAAIPGVKSVTPVAAWGYFDTVATGGSEVTLKNTNLIAYEPNGTITREVVSGRELRPGDDGNNVVISTEVANNLGFHVPYDHAVGASLTLTPRKNMGNGAGASPITLTVLGVITADGAVMEVTLNSAKTLIPTNHQCTGGGSNQQPTCIDQTELERVGYGSIYLNVDTMKNVDLVVMAAQKLHVGVAAGKNEIDDQQHVFTIIGLVLGGIGGIALFVAAIGVINTMVMATLERTREIGIMRAVGATKRTIRRLFTIEAGVLGFLGGVIGVGLSFGVAALLNTIVNKQLADSGVTARNVVSVPSGLAALVVAVTTGIGMLAGRLPARRAANLDPVEALRHE